MIIEPNNCYNIDCEIGMKLMQTQGLKADWCITDPPYGIGIDGQKLSINKNPKHNRKEFERLKDEYTRLTTKLGQVLLSIDTVKEMNTMCSIDEQRKQAKIDVLNELKKKKSITIWDIDELLKEYEK